MRRADRSGHKQILLIMEGSRETMETVDGSRDRESYIYIDDEDSNKFPAIGRPSVAGNEDDYDYAIELVPDVE